MGRTKSINENEVIMESKVKIIMLTITRDGSASPGGAVPVTVLENRVAEFLVQGYKIVWSSFVESVVEGHTLMFVLYKE